MTINKLVGASLVASALLVSVVPALAQSSSTATTTKKATHERQSQYTAAIGSCMATAVTTRDSAISSAIGTYSSAWQGAVQARGAALASAWQISDAKARRAAINKAWSDSRSSANSAKAAFKTARHNAWSQFYKDRKACSPNAASEDRATEGVDNQ